MYSLITHLCCAHSSSDLEQSVDILPNNYGHHNGQNFVEHQIPELACIVFHPNFIGIVFPIRLLPLEPSPGPIPLQLVDSALKTLTPAWALLLKENSPAPACFNAGTTFSCCPPQGEAPRGD